MEPKDVIKARREQLGLSKQALADRVGVSRGSVIQWEKGETTPKRAREQDVADALEITVDELLCRDTGNVIDVQGTFVEDRKSAIAIESGTQTPDAVEVISAALTQMSDEQREAMAGKLAALARAPDSPTLKKSISESLTSAPLPPNKT